MNYLIFLSFLALNPFTPDEVLLARLIESEARGESSIGKQMVGEVVINRCNAWNKSIEQVIYQKGQFDGIKSKYFKKYPRFKTLVIARKSLTSSLLPDPVLYFHNKAISTDTKWVRKLNSSEFITQGRHTFCFGKIKKMGKSIRCVNSKNKLFKSNSQNVFRANYKGKIVKATTEDGVRDPNTLKINKPVDKDSIFTVEYITKIGEQVVRKVEEVFASEMTFFTIMI